MTIENEKLNKKETYRTEGSALGMCFGTAICTALGNIFSQMAIWIFLGTMIAIYSPTKKAILIDNKYEIHMEPVACRRRAVRSVHYGDKAFMR